MSNPNLHLQLYRGTTAQNDAYTGYAGEITADTTLSNIRLHDGTKAGGTVIGGLPVGSIIPYAGTTIPDGWLLCDGSAISRSTYSALFASIGTTYGAGDGNSTFNLPTDLATDYKSKKYLIEVYENGWDYYRIYSDGWCEQGSRKIGGTDGVSSISFLKTFITTPHVYVSRIWRTGGDAGGTTADRRQVTINPPSLTDFSMWTNGWSTIDIDWEAFGYVNNTYVNKNFPPYIIKYN